MLEGLPKPLLVAIVILEIAWALFVMYLLLCLLCRAHQRLSTMRNEIDEGRSTDD